ncbi:choice-of-anchor D domain-containing protein [Hanstruepera flava]|uniref:choice-of-anchor D domain-containing protein n=1 Tax=Hanstruepera flava TaxID=2930218 RepID=UPI002029186F|nr:choice-of-anchor D domain-containing protein [Hanstruepera flava]
MLKKYALVSIAFFCAIMFGFGQTKIAELTFESPGGYTTSVPEVTSGSTDYFTRTDGTNINASFTNIQGSYYFAAQDIDGVTSSSRQSIYFSNINIAGYSSLEVRIHLAEDDDGSNQDWDDADYFHLSSEIDANAATYENLIWVEAAGGTNSEPRIDADFNGTGESTAITDSFSQFTKSISNTGNLLDITLTFNFNSGDEDIAVDNIEIWGVAATPTPTITVTPTTISGLDYVETLGPSAEQTFTVEGSNLTNNITLTAPTNFEISTTSGSGFGNSVTLIQSGGTVNNATIYTRLVSGLAVNTYSGNITATSTGATAQTIALNGEVTAAGGSNCTELFISEYVEGSSNNKYIEIYNPTVSTISLNNYRLAIYSNGSTTVSGSFNLNGTLPSFGTYVIANSAAVIYSSPDAVNNSVTAFNGNDVVALQTNGGTNIDVIGTIGSSATFAANTTLRRKSTVQIPNITYSSSEWDVYAQDTVSDLGSHTNDCQGPTPELQLVDNTATNQNCGYTIDFGTQAVASNTDLTFDIDNVGSADLNITSLSITGDYTIVSPAAPFTVTSGNSQTVTVRFTPSTNGTRTGVLTITNNDIDEGSCTVNLTGEGFTPTPEIDVERNTFASITSGNAPNGGNNTLFAATVIGNSTAPKTYYIRNEGTANLTISSLTSSNAAEFPINVNPAPITLLPNEFVAFEITFSPTGIGTRNSTISIVNNDSDENPYVINVQGNGDCAAGTLTFLPNNGPVGTIVNVTSTVSNFGGSTSATVNGITATVNVIASNEIEVTIPAGASTGSLIINDDLGCLSSDVFTIIDQLIADCEGSTGNIPSDLFISEVTDHNSGSHSYVEIFNGTGATVDLTDYEIRIHNNGATTATNTIPLTGSLTNNNVFVLAFGSTDATTQYASVVADLTDNASGINEDDHIRLYNTNTSTWVDLWGDTSGNTFTIASKNYTYRRKNTGIVAPSTTWNASDWEAFSPVDYMDIGNYDFSVGVPPNVTLQPMPPISECDLSATLSVEGEEGFDEAGDTQELAYQWYYSAPGDTGWIEINAAPYSGFNTATLSINNTLTLDGYQYYCQIREDSDTCYQASNAVKLSVKSTIWNGTTWSNNEPDANTIATIAGDYTTNASNGSFTACQLFVESGNLLTVAQGYFVEVINNVEVSGDGSGNDGIIIEDKGSFVQRGDGTAAGTFTLNTNGASKVNKRTAPLNNYYEYTYWSSPVLGETIGTGLSEGHPTRRYKYLGENYLDATMETNNNNATNPGQDDIDDNGDDWVFTPGTETMMPGKGYAAMHDPIGFTIVGGQYEYVFEGAFNTGDIDVTIYRNDSVSADNNWNFIGNPYPSAIDANEFLLVNSVIAQDVEEFPTGSGTTDGAIFLWSQSTAPSGTANGNENLNFAQSDYAIINATGQTAGGDNDNDGDIDINDRPNRFIPSGQGFFISYSNTGAWDTVNGDIKSGTVSFTNSMRTNGNNDQFFRTGHSDTANRLWVNMWSDNGVRNQILVGYVLGASNELDGMYYDAPKNLSTDVNAMIYTNADNSDKKLAIQGKTPHSLDLDEVIPLGFYTAIPEATLYSISVETEGLFFEDNIVYLKDKLLNVYHNLSNRHYTFSSEMGEFNERFEIVFRTDALSVDEVIANSNQLQIIELDSDQVKFLLDSQNLTIKTVEIFDLLGRIIYRFNGSNRSEIYSLSNLSSSAYMARVTLSNNQVIVKKAIKK